MLLKKTCLVVELGRASFTLGGDCVGEFTDRKDGVRHRVAHFIADDEVERAADAGALRY